MNNSNTPAKIVRLPSERLNELQELWGALYEHHHSLTPHLRPRARSLRDAWPDHLALERGWLDEDPRSFVLAAELDGRLVGYAFVRIATETLAVSWTISNPHADLVVLSVLPELRGRGIGTMLIDAVHTQLRNLDIHDLTITVITTNTNAQQLYERNGGVPYTTIMLQPVPEVA
jgi:ribosomal protein S18 acetylase RimI-like enzyme